MRNQSIQVGPVTVSYDGLNPRVEIDDKHSRVLVWSPEAVLALATVLRRYGRHMLDEERAARRRGEERERRYRRGEVK